MANAYPIKTAWERLKRWSAENLPQHGGTDAPPVTDEQLQEFEATIGAKLPKDIRESYQIYNGQCSGPGIIFGLAVEPLRDCLNHWKTWVEGYESALQDSTAEDLAWRCFSFPADFVRQQYFDRAWIPLTYDSSGNHIGVDLNPGPKGTRGQVIKFGRDDEFHTVLALSWGQFLADIADELEAGNYRLDTTDPDYPEFDLDDPHRKHFHSVGIYWSRGKLGLRRLSATDQRPWDKWHGK
jgi:cell wall assembly regulator SMI1